MTDLEKDLAFVLRKHGMLMLRDDGLSIQKLETCDGYYVCFRPKDMADINKSQSNLIEVSTIRTYIDKECMVCDPPFYACGAHNKYED